MSQPNKWFVGLVPVFVLLLVAGFVRQSPVESDLVARGNASLKEAGLEWAKVSLAGRDAVLTGEAPEPDLRQFAVNAADRAFGVRLVKDAMTVLPEAKPFTLSAVRDGGRVVLTGFAANAAQKAAIADAAKKSMPEATIVDELKIARGAPASFQAAAGFGLGELSKLSQGTLALSDSALSLTGRAADIPKWGDVRAKLASLPAGTTLGKGLGQGDILPPIVRPYTFAAEKTEQGVTLSGHVPNDQARAVVVAAANALGRPVTDRMQIADGAPASYANNVDFALARLGQLSTGQASLTDTSLTITGRAATIPGFSDVTARLAAMPQGMTLARQQITPPIVRPYTFAAEKTEQGVTLSGHVPSAQARGVVIAAANTLGRPVTDRMQIADGAPASYANNVDFALARLGQLSAGQASLSDTALTITGRAATIPGFSDVTARLAAMPQGMTLARQQITPPIVRPYTFAAEKTEQGVTLSGHVPSAQARGVVIAAANTLGRPVTDRMQIADGAPASYANNVDFALARLGQLATGQASLTDTSLTITGRAATMPNFTDVRARLASLPQGLTLSRQEIAPPVVRPFNFEVEKSASGVVLTGFVPNEAARAAIVAAAQQAGSPVTDRLQVADGAPVGDFAGAGRALLGELARLQTGKAMLIDTQATITGLGQSGVTEDAVRGALRQLPQGFQLARAQIEPGLIRPYLFNVTRGDNALTLSGHVPDQAARTALVDHARRFFEGDRVNDTLQIGPGAPQGFLNAARSGMQDLSRLLPGSSFAMSDQSVALRGLATHDGARDQILGEFRQRIPQGFGSMAEINTAPPPPAISALPECQILFNDLLSRGRILFNTGSAELAPESVGLLDRLVVVARRCNDAKLEVSGHTDADGAVAMNNDLSRRRAESVAQYLARAGISAERLEPVGYGPSRPVAPNDSAENKAKNRRIEFTVK